MKQLLVNNQGGYSPPAVIGTIALIIISAALWQWQASSQQTNPDDLLGDFLYVSPAGEFEITLPEKWTVGEASGEEEGVVQIELYGPRNNTVNAAFAQREGVESGSIEEALSNSRINELIQSEVGKEYALVQITAYSSAFYELNESPEAWQQAILAETSVIDGVSLSGFSPYSLETATGLEYISTLIEGDSQITARNYYLLGAEAEADILVFPADTNFEKEIEGIIDSIRFPVDEEILEDEG